MRKLLIFILGLIIGTILGGYFSYNFILDAGLEKFTGELESSLNQVYSGAAGLKANSEKIFKEKINEIKMNLEQKKEEMKTNFLNNVKNYLNEKINNIFGLLTQPVIDKNLYTINLNT